jgi:hypothetical protein
MYALIVALLLASSAEQSEREYKFFRNLDPNAQKATVNRFETKGGVAARAVAPPNRHEAANLPHYYVCPNDGAELKVPAGKAQAGLKCPLDGAEMKAGQGPQRRYYRLEEK